jgi:serine/threonine-protein kinase HipA
MQLDVYVTERLVGRLATEGYKHVFTYLPDTPADYFVSLTMPVRAESYLWHELHPIFQMNLPEGYLKDVLRRKFGPVATVDDISLLALTGRRSIGRIQVVAAGQTLGRNQPAFDLAGLLHSPDAQRLFLDYVEAGLTEGVSGVMPKTLAAVPGAHDKATVLTDEYVIKTGPHDLPGLAINEYLCLLAADRAHIAVPQFELSADSEVLALRRFDREAGVMLGLEDFCALRGQAPQAKYKGSHEDLAKVIKDRVAAPHQATAREQLLKTMLLNMAIYNADAHLKNFSLLYTGYSDVRLAPAYDLLTVPIYPNFHQDLPGLTLYGKKTWGCGKLMFKYAQQWLNYAPESARRIVDEVTQAMAATVPDIKRYAESYPQFREPAKRMLDYWELGMKNIQPDAKPGVAMAGTLRQDLGLSDEKQRKKLRNPYENPDGPFNHKSR